MFLCPQKISKIGFALVKGKKKVSLQFQLFKKLKNTFPPGACFKNVFLGDIRITVNIF